MKILHYIPSIDRLSGGVGAYMQLLTRDLGRGCELHVLTHSSGDELQLEGCTLHHLQSKWSPFRSCKNEFLQLLHDINPDVFHTNCCWMPLSALTAIWAKQAGYKVVYTPHGMLEPWIMKRHYWTKKIPAILLFQRRGLACADIVHATADSEKENLLKLGWNKRVIVVSNCVDVDSIEMKTSWKRTKNILFLSRVHVKKGIDFLIEAISILKNNMSDYTVTIAGSGDDIYIDKLKSLALKLGVERQIKFVGPVFGEAKFELFRKADLFVLPTYSENFGIVVTEALACGTPVVTTVGTPWHELENNNCGWWTEIGTEPTVRALESFLTKSEDELKQMGINGRKLVEEKYSCGEIANQFLNLYKGLTSNK